MNTHADNENTTDITEEQYDQMLEWIDNQFDYPPCIGTSAGRDVQTALLLIKAYEDIYYQIDN